MTVTPQTNTDLAGIAACIAEHDSFVLCGHVSPDGDCLGSQLTIYHALRAAGKHAVCLLAKADTIEAGLRFLPGIDDMVPAAEYDGSHEVFIAVDVPTVERMGDDAARIHAESAVTITVDHHANDEAVSDLAYVDPDAASTTMLAWELAGLIAPARTRDMAVCAYTGLVTDTGRFQFQNTDAAAFEAALSMVEAGASPSEVSREVFQSRSIASLALEGIVVSRMDIDEEHGYIMSWLHRSDFEKTGAVKADAEPLINVLRSIGGVRVACILREETDQIRGSFRAKDDTDVAALARIMGGGGHKAAAGFTLHGSLDEAIARVKGILDEALETPDKTNGK